MTTGSFIVGLTIGVVGLLVILSLLAVIKSLREIKDKLGE